MLYYIKHPTESKYLKTETRYIDQKLLFLTEKLLSSNLLEEKEINLANDFISKVKENYQVKAATIGNFNYYGLLLEEILRQPNVINNYCHYTLLVPSKFVNQKTIIDENINPEKLFNNYLVMIDIGQKVEKIKSLFIKYNHYFLQEDKKNEIEFLSRKEELFQKYNLKINNQRHEAIFKNNYEVTLNNSYFISAYSTKYKKLADLSTDYRNWQVEVNENKDKFYHQKGYVILYENHQKKSQFFSLKMADGGISSAQIFSTEKDAFVTARRRLGINSNFSIFEIDLRAIKEIKKNNNGAPQAAEINSYIEQQNIDDFFANNEIEKIKLKLKEYEEKNANNQTTDLSPLEPPPSKKNKI